MKLSEFFPNMNRKCKNDTFRKRIIKVNGSYLQYIKPENQTEELCLIAIEQDDLNIKHVKISTPRLDKLKMIHNL